MFPIIAISLSCFGFATAQAVPTSQNISEITGNITEISSNGAASSALNGNLPLNYDEYFMLAPKVWVWIELIRTRPMAYVELGSLYKVADKDILNHPQDEIISEAYRFTDLSPGVISYLIATPSKQSKSGTINSPFTFAHLHATIQDGLMEYLSLQIKAWGKSYACRFVVRDTHDNNWRLEGEVGRGSALKPATT